MVYSMVYHMVLISDFDGISQFLTCCADVWYHGFFWYIPWYITYFVVYTMLFEVLTCCADVWHHGFLWYVSFFPVICWVDLAYILGRPCLYTCIISQRCVISGLWCDLSDDGVWYIMVYNTVPKAGPLRLPWSSCTRTPRIPVTRPWLNLYVFDGTARLLARFTPGKVACSSLIGIKVAPWGFARLTAHAYIAVNAEHGNGRGQLPT